MRLLIHSYFAPLRSHLAGGAQQFVHDLLLGLASRCTSITVLCPDSSDDDLLDLGNTGRVDAVLIEPGPDSPTPYERHWNARTFVRRAAEADVVLSIDRGVPAQVDKPVVLCLNTLSYTTEVDALFGLAWDEIIVPSEYMVRSLHAVIGPHTWVGDARPIHHIPYSLDLAHLRRRDPAPLRARLGLAPDRRFVLFPHRPDPRKGFLVALRAIEQAWRDDPSLQLLIPLPPKSVRAVRHQEEEFVAGLHAEVRDRAIGDAVAFHPWIELADMPAYCSLGTAVLALSTLPESFGLTPLQSIACGTPVIATPAGAQPTLLPPDHGMTIVPFNDPGAVAQALTRLPSSAAVAAGRRYIAAAYTPAGVADRYLQVLREAKRSHARYVPGDGGLIQAPWCQSMPDGSIWHDFESGPLTGLDVAGLDGASADDLQKRGVLVPRSAPLARK